MIRAMVQLRNLETGHKEVLVKYWQDTILKKGMGELVAEVKYCRLKRTQKPEIVVQYSLTTGAEYAGMGKALAAARKVEKAELKVGPAPRGILKREARRLLLKLD